MASRTFHATLQLEPTGEWVATVVDLAEARGQTQASALRALAAALEVAVRDRVGRGGGLPTDRPVGVPLRVRVPDGAPGRPRARGGESGHGRPAGPPGPPAVHRERDGGTGLPSGDRPR